MRKARLWVIFGLGAAAMLPPVVGFADARGVGALWLFAVWIAIIVATALTVGRSWR